MGALDAPAHGFPPLVSPKRFLCVRAATHWPGFRYVYLTSAMSRGQTMGASSAS